MGSTVVPSNLALSDLDMSDSRTQTLVSEKGVVFGDM